MSNEIDPRVLFAGERTLLAWNRTSLALIAFGFLVERSGLLLKMLAPQQSDSLALLTSFWCGIAFIFLGVICALYSSRQYTHVLTAIGSDDIPKHYHPKWGIVVNILVAVLGIALIMALFLNA